MRPIQHAVYQAGREQPSAPVLDGPIYYRLPEMPSDSLYELSGCLLWLWFANIPDRPANQFASNRGPNDVSAFRQR
jgi:hypothetical protein